MAIIARYSRQTPAQMQDVMPFIDADARIDVASFHEIDLTIHDREIVVILGPSGCGKSTLLAILGGILRPTNGEVLIEGAHRQDR